MEWMSRYIDQPLLEGAAAALRRWHIHTGHRPEKLEPSWNLAVVLVLLAISSYMLSGLALAVSVATLVLLALPSALKLMRSLNGHRAGYGHDHYKSLLARAMTKREMEWAVRMSILGASATLPFIAGGSDGSGAIFLFGASVWFVLTAPAKFYLDAAEPPRPNDGGRAYRGSLQFG